MNQAVIVAAVRSPIGRAFKGSLVGLRPDDMSVQVLTALLGAVPALEPATIDDIIWGCASPAGEQGYNMARVVALLCGLREVPGTTVNRYCSSSLQAIRMAAHAIAADEGDVFVAGGVESVTRFAQGFADEMPGTHNPAFARSRAAVIGADRGGRARVAAGRRAPRYLHRHGADGRERTPALRRHPPGHGPIRPALSAKGCGVTGQRVFRGEIVPLTLADGTVVTADDGPRRGADLTAMAQLKPAFRPDGEVTAGNSCPLNDGAAAVLVMSERPCHRPRDRAPGPDRRQRRIRPRSGDNGAGTGRVQPSGAGPGGDDDGGRGPGRDQRSFRRPGGPLRRSARR